MTKAVPPKGSTQKVETATPTSSTSGGTPTKKNPVSFSGEAGPRKDEFTGLKDTAATVRQIKLYAQRELELAKQMRENARRYQQETSTRARSEAQRLILKTRLSTQRETEELIRQANEEIQKVLADIRMIRIMAQEELAAQRKFTDAARLRSMSLAIQDEHEKVEVKKK